MGKIENDEQYKRTLEWLTKFESSVSALRCAPLNGTHPMLRKAEIEGQESQIETFKLELDEYLDKKFDEGAVSSLEKCHYPDCEKIATVEVPYPGDGPNFVLPLCDEHDKMRIR